MINLLFVDFNSFFASVEQQLQPRLRGCPVAVVPLMADSTCCIATSIEAKQRGITTGTRVSEALRLCPRLHLIEANHLTYLKFHNRLIQAIESCLHVDLICSIDEVACRLPVNFRTPERARDLARHIKETIARTVGSCLTCSIGIAPNRFLAKTASDMQKPDGLIILELADLPRRLYALKLRDLCGIGRKMESRLLAHHIQTVEQLCAADIDTLRRVWGGFEGERMYRSLRGEDLTESTTHHATVGHSHVLPPHQRNETDTYAILSRLTQKAALRLRHLHFLAAGMKIRIRHTNQTRWSEEIIFQETQDTLGFLRLLELLWQRRPKPAPTPLAAGITLFRLVAETNSTASLFASHPSRRILNQTLDALNLEYGKNTLYFGSAHAARESAPLRIAFSRIPKPEEEGEGEARPRKKKNPGVPQHPGVSKPSAG